MNENDPDPNIKKKRGYTPLEKDILIDIVKRHIHLIENKCTNGEIIRKKQTAWQQVALQYNAVATSGARTWLQLRHLYENIKQKTKKNIATDNRQQYYMKELKIKSAEDKKQIMKTGGGAYRSSLNETDNQILAMVAPQIKPIRNPYDDAAVYFDDDASCDYAAVYCDDQVVHIEGNINMVDIESLQTNKPMIGTAETGESFNNSSSTGGF